MNEPLLAIPPSASRVMQRKMAVIYATTGLFMFVAAIMILTCLEFATAGLKRAGRIPALLRMTRST